MGCTDDLRDPPIRTKALNGDRRFIDSHNEINDLFLSPAAIVAVWIRQEGAMATSSCFDPLDSWIADELLARFGNNSNKRIVAGMNYQCRNVDFVEHSGGTGSLIVVLRAGKSFVPRRDFVVEFANTGKALQVREIVPIREQQSLSPITLLQSSKEALLVNP